MEWWLWLVLGLCLLVGEVLAPGGFILMFFGAGALILGLIVLAIPAMAAEVQWLAFSALSVALLVAFRAKLRARFGGGAGQKDVDDLVGKSATAMGDLAPGALGQVELRGTSWSAINVGTANLLKGEACTVSAVEGLKLMVKR